MLCIGLLVSLDYDVIKLNVIAVRSIIFQDNYFRDVRKGCNRLFKKLNFFEKEH